ARAPGVSARARSRETLLTRVAGRGAAGRGARAVDALLRRGARHVGAARLAARVIERRARLAHLRRRAGVRIARVVHAGARIARLARLAREEAAIRVRTALAGEVPARDAGRAGSALAGEARPVAIRAGALAHGEG